MLLTCLFYTIQDVCQNKLRCNSGNFQFNFFYREVYSNVRVSKTFTGKC